MHKRVVDPAAKAAVHARVTAWKEPSGRSNTARLLVGLGGGDDLAIAGGKIECMDDDEYFLCLLL